MRRLSDDDLARGRRGLQPGSAVHHRSRHEELTFRAAARRGLARLDPDAHLERLGQPELFGKASDPRPDREARAHRPEPVVFMYPRQPEHRHHGIPDEFLGSSSQRNEFGDGHVVEPAQHLAGAFRVEPLREDGRVDEIREQDGHDLALVGARGLIHDRATAGAEPGPPWERRAAIMQFIAQDCP